MQEIRQFVSMISRSLVFKVLLLGVVGSLDSEKNACVYSVAPDLKQPPPPRVVKPVGQDEVKLMCNVRDQVNYTWYKNGRKIHQPDDRYFVKTPRYLRITDVVKSDSGLFVCVTSNKYGTTNCTTRLIIEDPTVSPTNVSGAAKPRFTYPDEMTKAESQYTEGDTFRLTCEATGTPIPTVTWYKGKEIYRGHRSETITPGLYDYKISFKGVDLKDGGNYTCVVKNSHGSLAHSYVFDVKEKIRSEPQILSIWEQKDPEYAGTDLQLHCTVLSKDINTKFEWYFSKSFIPDEDNPGTLLNQTLFEAHLVTSPKDSSWLKWKSVLNLKNLSVADSGSYSCKAKNVLGPDQRGTYLNVTTRPITPSPAASFGCDLNRSRCSSVPPDTEHPVYHIGNDLPCLNKNKVQVQVQERPSPTNCIKKTPTYEKNAFSLTLSFYEEKTSDALVPGIVSACLLITVATLVVICWCRQSRTKKSVHNPVSKVEFEYDAFIIFSSQDSDWVIKTLIPTLEEKHQIKCCVHYRDFVPGVPFRENMVNSVYKSRITIAVVSINFFNSNYCGSEMDYALLRLKERRDDSLVVIKLDDVDRRKLPKELRKRSYIDYQKNVEKDHWERKLVNCLKNPNDLYKETIL